MAISVDIFTKFIGKHIGINGSLPYLLSKVDTYNKFLLLTKEYEDTYVYFYDINTINYFYILDSDLKGVVYNGELP